MFALFLEFGTRTRPQDLSISLNFLISEAGLKFLISTQGEIRPGNRASPVNRTYVKRIYLTIISWARMGYWLRGHEGERNNYFSKIQLVGQKYRE